MKAETGSGKTLAYLISIVEKLYQTSLKEKIKREDGTRAIIISPTRELAAQIEKEFKNLTHKHFPYLISCKFSLPIFYTFPYLTNFCKPLLLEERKKNQKRRG